MTAFILLALVMTLLAIGAVVWPLRRRRTSGRRDDEAGIDVYRERDAELVREHERGNLNDAEFAEAREELERELLAVAPDQTRRTTTGNARSLPALLVFSATVPVVAIAVYIATGSPDLIGGGGSSGLSPAQVERFRNMEPERRIAELEPVVERQPEATRAWILLAQAYRATERYGDAVSAYARVQAQGDPDPWLMARQAEALLLANGRRFTDSVDRLVPIVLAKSLAPKLGSLRCSRAAARASCSTSVWALGCVSGCVLGCVLGCVSGRPAPSAEESVEGSIEDSAEGDLGTDVPDSSSNRRWRRRRF